MNSKSGNLFCPLDRGMQQLMLMNKTKKGIVAFLLAGAVLVSMVGMASAHNSITWDFDSETTTAGREMERCGGPGDNGQTGSVLGW